MRAWKFNSGEMQMITGPPLSSQIVQVFSGKVKIRFLVLLFYQLGLEKDNMIRE